MSPWRARSRPWTTAPPWCCSSTASPSAGGPGAASSRRSPRPGTGWQPWTCGGSAARTVRPRATTWPRWRATPRGWCAPWARSGPSWWGPGWGARWPGHCRVSPRSWCRPSSRWGAPHPLAMRSLRGRLLSGSAMQYLGLQIPGSRRSACATAAAWTGSCAPGPAPIRARPWPSPPPTTPISWRARCCARRPGAAAPSAPVPGGVRRPGHARGGPGALGAGRASTRSSPPRPMRATPTGSRSACTR